MYAIIKISLLCAFLSSMSVTSAFTAQLTVDGERIVIKTDSGEAIDTANLPKGENTQSGDDIEVNEKGISIGSITGSSSSKNGIQKKTTLENVTIINNGKTTTYNPKKQQ